MAKRSGTTSSRTSGAILAVVRRLLEATTDPALRQVKTDDILALLDSAATPSPPAPDSNGARPQRWQDQLIEDHIPAGASVLDLGCGNGELLARLIQRKQVRGQGIELDSDEIFECVQRGVPVFQANLDLGLSGFADQRFDYVVLEETLQTLHRPIDVLNEMLRVGRHGIVSFPNFAYWRVRLDLTLGGRMPITERLPYRWYDTPNIHLFSVQDFLDWASANGARIVSGHALCEGQVRKLADDDNLRAEEVLMVVEKR
jgi:methionine biosynthesis protein MetW